MHHESSTLTASIRSFEQYVAIEKDVTLLYRGHDIEASTSGVTVTLIDFTLSRLTAPTGDIAFCNLAADPELFTGPKGDVQVCLGPFMTAKSYTPFLLRLKALFC